MHINSQIEQVEEGSTIYIPPQSIQFIENAGSQDLVFLCIVDPAWKKEDEIVL